MGTGDVVFGQVIAVHIEGDFLTSDCRIDVLRARPFARLGYCDYTRVQLVFEMVIPNSTDILAGLEGSAANACEQVSPA